MSQPLEPFVDKLVSVITNDGRHIVGTLRGFDQCVNVIVDESYERVYSTAQGVEVVSLGLYVIRGDNLAVIGQIDEAADAALQQTFPEIRCEPLKAVAHS
jgi:U6 snRNA-associated Sm-like protein LSm8|eukprot:CAMPEP_0174291716 /NCGR_PEP_ID=MMETSP0809-20121228/33005_1 /TAXON_ID=73025 ORGANISM="Eutreptiella gymnastica-like, Strain CCMP1594" /NCGR_SAMPLE_ID=MMETSP0809 /ASSEMBLY_ACC=CAM_ASM_000658 /LENGTH=99 /DNA_ID=CAMNT_0015391247 /DNA_START=37 /DNA_END=336 /DNA_ORIENTATION=+